MIQITDKEKCCGCNACGDICPKQAITFKTDNEGFWYPEVDLLKCIDCGLCEKTCPCLNEKEQQKPFEVYAAINPDEETRRQSSSGGIFWALVNKAIKEGSIVFGAAFNEKWQVCHSSAVTIEDAKIFQGSKYVQSRVEGCYKQVQDALKKGRKVLFSGTACQIAALNDFLRKDYDNLVTVDVACHGVPSPGVWNDYVSSLTNSRIIKDINFRDKRDGWDSYGFSIEHYGGIDLYEPHNSNLYMRGYLHNLYLRPSCHSCHFKAGRCGSDFTLGDFWGIDKVLPELNDNRGVSVVFVNSDKGKVFIQTIGVRLFRVSYEQAISGNPCLIKASPVTPWRNIFFKKYEEKGLAAIQDLLKRMQPSLIRRLASMIKRVLHK